MTDLVSLIYDGVKNTINTWSEDDIYVISFFVYDDDDDPSRPTLTVGYNTMKNYQSHNPFDEEEAEEYGIDEAKWNYAFWLQNEEYTFGRDENSAKLIQDWILSSGFPEPVSSFDENYDGVVSEVTQAFVNMLIDVSSKLHKDGIIVEKFGKSIPIIIHELEYYDEIAAQNKKANPSDVIKEFVQWIEEL